MSRSGEFRTVDLRNDANALASITSPPSNGMLQAAQHNQQHRAPSVTSSLGSPPALIQAPFPVTTSMSSTFGTRPLPSTNNGIVSPSNASMSTSGPSPTASSPPSNRMMQVRQQQHQVLSQQQQQQHQKQSLQVSPSRAFSATSSPGPALGTNRVAGLREPPLPPKLSADLLDDDDDDYIVSSTAVRSKAACTSKSFSIVPAGTREPFEAPVPVELKKELSGSIPPKAATPSSSFSSSPAAAPAPAASTSSHATAATTAARALDTPRASALPSDQADPVKKPPVAPNPGTQSRVVNAAPLARDAAVTVSKGVAVATVPAMATPPAVVAPAPATLVGAPAIPAAATSVAASAPSVPAPKQPPPPTVTRPPSPSRMHEIYSFLPAALVPKNFRRALDRMPVPQQQPSGAKSPEKVVPVVATSTAPARSPARNDIDRSSVSRLPPASANTTTAAPTTAVSSASASVIEPARRLDLLNTSSYSSQAQQQQQQQQASNAILSSTATRDGAAAAHIPGAGKVIVGAGAVSQTTDGHLLHNDEDPRTRDSILRASQTIRAGAVLSAQEAMRQFSPPLHRLEMALREAAHEPPLTSAYSLTSSAAPALAAGAYFGERSASSSAAFEADPIVVDVDALGMADFSSAATVSQHFDRRAAFEQQRDAFFPGDNALLAATSPFRFLPNQMTAMQQQQQQQQQHMQMQQLSGAAYGFDQLKPLAAAARPSSSSGASGDLVSVANIRRAVSGMARNPIEEDELTIRVALVLQNLQREARSELDYLQSEQQQSQEEGDAFYPSVNSPVPLSGATANSVAAQLQASSAQSSLHWPQFSLPQSNSYNNSYRHQPRESWYPSDAAAEFAASAPPGGQVTHYFSPPLQAGAHSIGASMAAATAAAWAKSSAPALSPKDPQQPAPSSREWQQRLNQHAWHLQRGAHANANATMMMPQAPTQFPAPNFQHEMRRAPPHQHHHAVVFDSSSQWGSWQ